MNAERTTAGLSWTSVVGLSFLAIAAFHLAYSFATFSSIIVLYVGCLCWLANAGTPRKAFYSGLVVGIGVYAPQLSFFWLLFGPTAIALWLVLSFWIALFVLLIHLGRRRIGPTTMAFIAPCIWTALEYFRSELYYLRFSWLNVGYAFAHSPQISYWGVLGTYGIGFLFVLLSSLVSLLPKPKVLLTGVALLAALFSISALPAKKTPPPVPSQTTVAIAGIQLEFPAELAIPTELDKVILQHPKTEILVVSEYSLEGTVPQHLLDWCQRNQRYLIIGGKEAIDQERFYNTAFVVGPDGRIIFQQAKVVPIQFFKDGEPAKRQQVWNSPWGKIGICICYDLSYKRVTDALIKQGAQLLIVPTMDVETWGRHQHELHTRIAAMRAAEYRVPIFRLASSGISQCVDPQGRVTDSAPFPGQHEILYGQITLPTQPDWPLDHYVVPLSLLVSLLYVVSYSVSAIRNRFVNKSISYSSPSPVSTT